MYEYSRIHHREHNNGTPKLGILLDRVVEIRMRMGRWQLSNDCRMQAMGCEGGKESALAGRTALLYTCTVHLYRSSWAAGGKRCPASEEGPHPIAGEARAGWCMKGVGLFWCMNLLVTVRLFFPRLSH